MISTSAPSIGHDPVPWPGPSFDPATGTVALGPLLRADGLARWRLYSHDRLWGGLLCGASGSGLSRTVESIAVSAAATAVTCVWYGDPQRGASSPLLARHADYVAGDVATIREMLGLAVVVKDLRRAENCLYGWDGFTPTEDRPGLLIAVDECHRAFADPAVGALATELVREGGKCGVAIVAAMSEPVTLDAFGGRASSKEAEALRSSLCAGNLVVFRCTSRTSTALPGLDVDPTRFPRIPGFACLVGDTAAGRSGLLRTYRLDPRERDAGAECIAWRGLDTAAAKAAGDGYLARRSRAGASARTGGVSRR
jgi:hypothetical protein